MFFPEEYARKKAKKNLTPLPPRKATMESGFAQFSSDYALGTLITNQTRRLKPSKREV